MRKNKLKPHAYSTYRRLETSYEIETAQSLGAIQEAVRNTAYDIEEIKDEMREVRSSITEVQDRMHNINSTSHCERNADSIETFIKTHNETVIEMEKLKQQVNRISTAKATQSGFISGVQFSTGAVRTGLIFILILLGYLAGEYNFIQHFITPVTNLK